MPPPEEDNTAIIAVVVVCIIIIITATALCIVGWKKWGWFGGKKAEAAVPVVPAADTNAGTTVESRCPTGGGPCTVDTATEVAVTTVDTDTNTGDGNSGGGGNGKPSDTNGNAEEETPPFFRPYSCWENDSNIKRGDIRAKWGIPTGQDKTWRPGDGEYTIMCNKEVEGCKSSKKCFGKPLDWVNPVKPLKEEDVDYGWIQFRCLKKDGKPVIDKVFAGTSFPNSPQNNNKENQKQYCAKTYPSQCANSSCTGELGNR